MAVYYTSRSRYQNKRFCVDYWTITRTCFYRFFETEPDMKALFPKIVQMNESNQLEWQMDRDMLQKHAVTVMEGLGAAVESLEDSDFLNSVMVSIGQTHVRRNVKPQYVKKLWPSLHYGLGVCLGDHYNKEVSEAWRKVYIYISAQMTRGMKNPNLKTNDELS
ncbi:hypothetical protein LOTGIDRAFT_232639 [Lottia gigantea]|uniref:Globin n=1 Tax=Lottia gigantea TaxID=225164 RepID=V4BX16_LOTGI|nr:hypothetical protein LOTGIDRAFT_232639 [Lottia gigantea]ESO93594.1 hypothetical protein LOTGIDRAFT_232639 [Lottia gigantea]